MVRIRPVWYQWMAQKGSGGRPKGTKRSWKPWIIHQSSTEKNTDMHTHCCIHSLYTLKHTCRVTHPPCILQVDKLLHWCIVLWHDYNHIPILWKFPCCGNIMKYQSISVCQSVDQSIWLIYLSMYLCVYLTSKLTLEVLLGRQTHGGTNCCVDCEAGGRRCRGEGGDESEWDAHKEARESQGRWK